MPRLPGGQGEQFGKPRNKSWKEKIIGDNIEALDIYWYESVDKRNNDKPSAVEKIIVQKFCDIYGTVPNLLYS